MEGTTKIEGTLEIDRNRGVIYFHTTDPTVCNALGTITVLRICSLPKPIPSDRMLDVTHMVGTSWVGADSPLAPKPPTSR